MNLNNKYVSYVIEEMPLESLLFFIYHIWLFVIVLTAIIVIGTGIHVGLDIFLIIITLGLFTIYLVPIFSIIQNIVSNKKEIKKVLCCVPLLIVGTCHIITAFSVQIKIVMYEGHPDLLIYTLLVPIQKLVGFVADPIIEEIFNMNFPYNMLIPIVFYIIIFPISLLIYLLPSIDYGKIRITKEMKLIALLPPICVILPVIMQIIRKSFGLIDNIMVEFFWTEILFNIGNFLFLLMPILGILYIKHYKRVNKKFI